MLTYIIASILYLIYTRCMTTPLADSLTDEQKLIKKQSSKKRLHVFLASVAIASIGLYVLKPFQNC